MLVTLIWFIACLPLLFLPAFLVYARCYGTTLDIVRAGSNSRMERPQAHQGDTWHACGAAYTARSAAIILSAIRKALHGNTHRRGRSEARGRKRRVSARAVEALDRTRKRLQEKADGEDEVT